MEILKMGDTDLVHLLKQKLDSAALFRWDICEGEE